MKTRIVVGGLLALLVMTSTASALKDVIVTSYSLMAERLEDVDLETLSRKQARNLAKARARLGNEPETMERMLRNIERAAGSVGKALGGTSHAAGVQSALFVIADAVRIELLAVADELEARNEGEILDELPDGFPDGPRPMVMREPSDKVRKLLARARALLIGGDGNDRVIGDKGKALKRRMRAFRKAVDKLESADTKLTKAGR